MNKIERYPMQKPFVSFPPDRHRIFHFPFGKQTASANPPGRWAAVVRLVVVLAAVLFSSAPFSNASVLEDIQITEIREMVLRDESGNYFLDIVSIIRNTGKNAMKFTECRVNLSFALEDTENIFLGKAYKKEIYLEGRKNDEVKETEVMLTAELGRDIERIHLAMIESEEMTDQFMEAKPELKLEIRGRFELGIQSQNRRAWAYQDEVKIDWITKTKVPRDVFIDTYKRLEFLALKKSGRGKKCNNEWIDLDFEQTSDSE